MKNKSPKRASVEEIREIKFKKSEKEIALLNNLKLEKAEKRQMQRRDAIPLATKRKTIESLLYTTQTGMEIAKTLGMAYVTFKVHCRAVYKTNKVTDRVELMAQKIEKLQDEVEMHYEAQASSV